MPLRSTTRTISVLIASASLLAVAAGLGQSMPPRLAGKGVRSVEADKPAGPPKRVILRVGIDEDVAGTVVEESPSAIVISTVHDVLKSYPRSRILAMTTLTNPDPVTGRPGTVFLRDGSEHEGVVFKDDFDVVVMTIEDVKLRLARARVDRVVLQPTFDEQYAHYKATLNPESTGDHFELCHWLYDQKQWKLARAETLELLRTHPEYGAGRDLLRVIDAQIILAGDDAALRSDDDVTDDDTTDRDPDRDPNGRGANTRAERAARQRAAKALKKMSRDEINWIRIYEIDFKNPPNVRVDRDAFRRMLREYSDDDRVPTGPDVFREVDNSEDIDLVRFMFELRARSYYPTIDVRSEPQSLRRFKDRVHDTWLVGRCGSCHHENGPGNFRLHVGQVSEAERYTNFLTLERFRLADGRQLLDYEKPEDSILLDFALPRHSARFPHPDVSGLRPIFRNRADSRVRQTTQWIGSLFQPRPDYPVEFDPNVPPRTQAPGRDSEPSGESDRPDR